MLFALGSITAAGLAALNTFKNKLFNPDETNIPTLNLNIKMNLGNTENVTISPEPHAVVGPQFDFKLIDTNYDFPSASPNASAISLSFQNQTYKVDIYPSHFDFIPDSDPPTAEAQVNIPLLRGLAEGSYNLTIMEWQWGGPLNSPTGFSSFNIPLTFVFDPKTHEERLVKEEL